MQVVGFFFFSSVFCCLNNRYRLTHFLLVLFFFRLRLLPFRGDSSPAIFYSNKTHTYTHTTQKNGGKESSRAYRREKNERERERDIEEKKKCLSGTNRTTTATGTNTSDNYIEWRCFFTQSEYLFDLLIFIENMYRSNFYNRLGSNDGTRRSVSASPYDRGNE